MTDLSGKEIHILGLGIAGLCAANELAQYGAELHLYDPNTYIGKHQCSYFAGGMLAPFCEGADADPIVVEMGQFALQWWQKHTNLVEKKGSLAISFARDMADLKHFAKRTGHHQWLDRDGMIKLEEDLADSFQKGLYFADEGHLDPRVALQTLRQNLVDYGVKFIAEERLPNDFSYEQIVVDCRGLNAKNELKDLRGVKGEMMLIHCPDVHFSRPIRLLHPRMPIYLVPRGEGVYMLGASMIENCASRNMSVRSSLELLSALYALNPAFGEAEILEVGCDFRPSYPDNIPSLKQTGNHFSINGLYRHGYLCAPSLAHQLAQKLGAPT